MRLSLLPFLAAFVGSTQPLEPQDPRRFFDELLFAKDQAMLRARNLEAMLVQERGARAQAELSTQQLSSSLAAEREARQHAEGKSRSLEKEVSELTLQLEREMRVRKASMKPLYQAALLPRGLTVSDTIVVDWSSECASMVKVLDLPDADAPNLPHVESAVRSPTGTLLRHTLSPNASFSVIDANSIAEMGPLLARLSARDNVDNLGRLHGSLRGSAEGINTLRRRVLHETVAAIKAAEWAKGHLSRIENASNATETAFNLTEG